MEPFTEENKENTIYIADEESKVVTCYDRKEIITWLLGTPQDPKIPLVEWVGMKDEIGHGGKPTNYPVFKMPYGTYIDLPAVRVLLYPNITTFYLEKVRTNVAIGNAQGQFGVSQLHGQERVDIYTLFPEQSQLNASQKGLENALVSQFDYLQKQLNVDIKQAIDVLEILIGLSDVLSVNIAVDIIYIQHGPRIEIKFAPAYFANIIKMESDAIFTSGTWYTCVNETVKAFQTFFKAIDSTMDFQVYFDPPLPVPFARVGPILPELHIPIVNINSFSVFRLYSALNTFFSETTPEDFPIQIQQYPGIMTLIIQPHEDEDDDEEETIMEEIQ